MDKHFNNIKDLIENNLIEVKRQEISTNYHTLITYFNVGKELIEAQGGEERAKYGNSLIKEYSVELTKKFSKGYNTTNLKRMRQLYLYFRKVGPVGPQLEGEQKSERIGAPVGHQLKGEQKGAPPAHQLDNLSKEGPVAPKSKLLEKGAALRHQLEKAEKLAPVAQQLEHNSNIGPLRQLFTRLTWTHFKSILPIKDENKRNFYINSIIEHNFSKRQLIDYIKSNAYERLINKGYVKLKYIDVNNEDSSILDIIKNPILIIINKSIDKITEKALRKFMLEQIELTMLELGAGFAYVGSEKPIRIDNKILRPDLVFFNYDYNCFVILELKLNELTIRDIGQIEFYVKVYDSDIKKPFHNPTIGITVSKRVNPTLLDYNSKENIKHSTYELINIDGS